MRCLFRNVTVGLEQVWNGSRPGKSTKLLDHHTHVWWNMKNSQPHVYCLVCVQILIYLQGPRYIHGK